MDTRNLSPDSVLYSLEHELINLVSSLTLVLHLILSKIASGVFRERVNT